MTMLKRSRRKGTFYGELVSFDGGEQLHGRWGQSGSSQSVSVALTQKVAQLKGKREVLKKREVRRTLDSVMGKPGHSPSLERRP